MESKKIKIIFLSLILGVILLCILLFFTNFIVATIAGIIGTIITFVIGYNFFKKELIEDIKSDLEKDNIPQDVGDSSIESLICLEEYIALNDTQLEKEVAIKVASLIQSLIDVVQEINNKFSSQSVTFEVTNLAQEHFPNRVKSFLNLKENDRSAQQKKLLLDIEKMEEIVKKVVAIIQNDTLNKDERESLLAQIKYGTI